MVYFSPQESDDSHLLEGDHSFNKAEQLHDHHDGAQLLSPEQPEAPPDCVRYDPALRRPIGPNPFGLPTDFCFEHDSADIPTEEYMQRVIAREMARWEQWIADNQDSPEIIAEQLKNIAEFVLAAIHVQGDHQTDVIRLGLTLELRYWIQCDRLHEWSDFIAALLSVALQLRHYELDSRVYRAWGIFFYITQDQPRSKKALDIALSYADDSGREDLRLLARVERFNMAATQMNLSDAQAETEAILVEAHRSGDVYVQGRAYLSLARAYKAYTLPKEAFNFAQQALLCFAALNILGLASEAIHVMLSSLQRHSSQIHPYSSNLLTYLDLLSQRGMNPWAQAATYSHQAIRYYHRAEYNKAREYALKAWVDYRAIHQKGNYAQGIHMLGLIQTKRRCWGMAERHLEAAYRRYRESGQDVQAVHARHAHAFIPYEQNLLEPALIRLEKTLHMAEALPEKAVRDRLVKLIQDDIDDITRQLSQAPR